MAWDSDIGDGTEGTLRDAPPDLLAPIDPRAPIGGHRPPSGESPASVHETPEHDWSVASALVTPLLRPSGTHGTQLTEIDPTRLASEGLRAHALPVVDRGPGGLCVAYAIRAGGFDVLVNADHLLEWHVSPDDLRTAAARNLAQWSAGADWTDEADGGRRLLSSDTGGGSDAARILLSDVRAHLSRELGGDGRVIVAMPERHLLIAGALRSDDPDFAELFADFAEARAEGADEPIERGVFELIGDELVSFVA